MIQYLGGDIEQLNLSGNSVTDLNRNLFKSLSNLNSLYCNTNIKYVSPDVFQYLSAVVVLDVSNNQLPELDFRLMHQRIGEMHINNNRLQQIMNSKSGIFLTPNKFDIADNCFTDDHVKQILKNATGITFLTHAFKQKTKEECAKYNQEALRSNGNKIWIIIIVVISVIVIV